MLPTQETIASQPLMFTWAEELIDHLASWWVTGPIVALSLAYAVGRHVKLYRECRDIKQTCWNLQAVIIHEIRTPLCAIQKLLEQAMALGPTPTQLGKLISTAQGASCSVVELLDDLLTQSKLEIGKLTLNPQPTNLPDLVQNLTDTYGNLARQKNLEFSVCSNCAVADIQIDVLRLRQILSNLLSNATKFTPEGQITLHVASYPTHAGWAKVEIKVIDTGIGIADTTKATLFTPFGAAGETARQHYGGSGLGLYLCQQLTQLMHGSLQIKSQPGQGTEMHLSFACKQADSTPAYAAAAPFQGMRALIVDDDPANQLLLKFHLEQQGLKVKSCNDGEQALRQWEPGSYDILFCDLHMPTLSGSQLITRIRSLEHQQGNKSTPIVVVSTNSGSEIFTQEVNYRLNKPVDPIELRQALHHCLTSTASLQPTPLVRLEVLHQLSRGDHLFEVDFIRSVLKNNREDLENLLSAYPCQDLQKMTETLHRLIGVIRLLGSDTFTEQCRRFEQALSEQQTQCIEQQLPIVLQGIRAMNEELQQQLER